MKQRVLMFDFDGVIADSFDVFYPALVRTLREYGYACVRNPGEFRVLLDRNFCRSSQARHIRRSDLNEILAETGRKVQARMGDMHLFPGVKAAIQDLNETCPLYVITSNQSTPVEVFLKRVGLLECFRDVLGADDHPSKIQKIRLIRRLHPRQSLVYVGDTVGDLREARSARVGRAAVLWGWHERERLCGEQPEFLLETPDDLRRLHLPA